MTSNEHAYGEALRAIRILLAGATASNITDDHLDELRDLADPNHRTQKDQ